MTVLGAGVALAPLAILGNVSGLEAMQPLAAIILGGLVTTALVSLFVLPTLYLRFARNPHSDAGPAPDAGVEPDRSPRPDASPPVSPSPAAV
jgi:predicted exporter